MALGNRADALGYATRAAAVLSRFPVRHRARAALAALKL
jgi:hypothetical protein